MNRFTKSFLRLSLLFATIAALAWAAVDTTNLTALQLDTSSLAPYAFRIMNPAGAEVFSIATDGTVVSSGGGFTLANSESLNTDTDAVFDFTRNDAGVVTLTASDDNSTAAMTLLAGGAAALTLGGTTGTSIQFIADTDYSFRNGATGAVTIDLRDYADTTDDDMAHTLLTTNCTDASTGAEDCDFTIGVVEAGAAAETRVNIDADGGITLGTSNNNSLTVTTDSTGTAEVALPAGSIDTTEVLDGTLLPADEASGGKGSFLICGDAVTVNNNTVFYGPAIGITSSATVGQQTCDTTAAGNTTEATADAPVFTAKAFQVTGFICRDDAAEAHSRVFTLRSAAAATTPSVTCTMGSSERDCVADVQTTTAIASGATVAMSVNAGTDVTTNNFVCEVFIAF